MTDDTQEAVPNIIPPERFVGRLKEASGRDVAVDDEMAFNLRMAGVGETPLKHSREGLHALAVRLQVAANEMRSAIGDFYNGRDSLHRCKLFVEQVDAIEQMVATDIGVISRRA